MKKIIKNIEFELKYLKFKKMFWIIIIFCFAVNMLTMYMDGQYVASSYNEYRYAQEFYEDNSEEAEEDGYNITKNEDGTTTVSNPLQFHYDQVSQSLFVVSPKYYVAQILEMSFVLLPLLYCILAAFLANCDKTNGMYRHKILRFGRESYFISKLAVGVGIIVLGVIFTAFLGKLLNIPFYRYICNSYPTDEFESGYAGMLSNDFIKIIIVILICLVLYSVTFAIALITRSSTISTLIVILYNYLAPSKFSYGLKNCYRVLLKENFDFYGVVNISGVKDVNIVVAASILIGIIVISQFISYIAIKKKRLMFRII